MTNTLAPVISAIKTDSMNPMTNHMTRFFSYVEVNDESECWEWTGSLADGYAVFSHKRSNGTTSSSGHRFSHEQFKGTIPAGYEVDHICRNRRCVNPRHLEAVTPYVNNMRSNSGGAINSRKEVCKNGHPFAGENLIVRSNGTRQCAICVKELHMDRLLDQYRALREKHEPKPPCDICHGTPGVDGSDLEPPASPTGEKP